MKFFIAFTLLLVGTSAVPSLRISPELLSAKANPRFIEGIVAGIVEDLIQQMQEAGLDPLNIDSLGLQYRLPVTDLVDVRANAESIVLTGLSNIVISRINYAVLTGRVTFDIELPRIAASIGSTGLDVQIFGGNINTAVSGSFAIVRPRAEGEVRISIGIISGITIRSVDVDFTLGGVESNLNFVLQGTDYSDQLNTFLGTTVPNAIATNRAQLNELIEWVIWGLIDDTL